MNERTNARFSVAHRPLNKADDQVVEDGHGQRVVPVALEAPGPADLVVDPLERQGPRVHVGGVLRGGAIVAVHVERVEHAEHRVEVEHCSLVSSLFF